MGLRWQASQQFQALPHVLDHVSDPAIVILGSPSSGKPTLPRHYELDCARKGAAALARGVKTEDLPLTFFLPLGSYKPARSDEDEPLPLPEVWLTEQWEKLVPDLPPLEVTRSVTLLRVALVNNRWLVCFHAKAKATGTRV